MVKNVSEPCALKSLCQLTTGCNPQKNMKINAHNAGINPVEKGVWEVFMTNGTGGSVEQKPKLRMRIWIFSKAGVNLFLCGTVGIVGQKNYITKYPSKNTNN